MSDWTWRRDIYIILAARERGTKIGCTIHHVVPSKLTPEVVRDMEERHQVVDFYHFPCEISARSAIEACPFLMGKPSFVAPFWVNFSMWGGNLDERDSARLTARRCLGLSMESFLVGSFQRDTEGHDLKSPKLEKGPDVFADYVIESHKRDRRVKALLGGWRRQYVIDRLEKVGVPYVYIERPPHETIRQMYAALDLYVVGARWEGGPQAVFECAAGGIPIISTPIGGSKYVLSQRSIAAKHPDDASWSVDDLFACTPDVETSHEMCKKYDIAGTYPTSFFADMVVAAGLREKFHLW